VFQFLAQGEAEIYHKGFRPGIDGLIGQGREAAEARNDENAAIICKRWKQLANELNIGGDIGLDQRGVGLEIA